MTELPFDSRKRYYVEGGENPDFPSQAPVEPDVADRLMALKGETGYEAKINLKKKKGKNKDVAPADPFSDPTVVKYVQIALQIQDQMPADAAATQQQYPQYPQPPPVQPPPQHSYLPPHPPQARLAGGPRSMHERW